MPLPSMEVEEEARRRWEDLPMDCLSTVFSKLGLDDRTLSVPFVCRSWHAASLDPHCWKTLNFRELNLMPWSDFNVKFAGEYGIKSFSFSGFMKLLIYRSRGLAVELAFPSMLGASMKDLIYASNQCPRVRTLALPTMLHEEEKQLPELLANFAELEQLDLGLKPHCFAEIMAQVGKNLTSLRTYGCFTGDDAAAVVTHAPKLRFLGMSGSFLDREQLCLILDGCRSLEGVDVSKCRGFDGNDKEVRKKAARIRCFECGGSKVREEYWEDSDDCYGMLWGVIFGEN